MRHHAGGWGTGGGVVPRWRAACAWTGLPLKPNGNGTVLLNNDYFADIGKPKP